MIAFSIFAVISVFLVFGDNISSAYVNETRAVARNSEGYAIREFGNVEPTPRQKDLMNLAHKNFLKSGKGIVGTTVIDTVIHVVKPTANSFRNEAEYFEQQQINVLNKAFRNNGMGFKFNLVKIKTHVNRAYWNEPVQDGSTMKQVTHVGDFSTLNIWFTNVGPQLGYATFPAFDYVKQDGIVIYHGTVKGGSFYPFNLGATLIHEVGHWLGLPHTFENGCDPGDGIADTAPEKRAAFGCPVGRDTCPGDGLEDPIHNFMDFTDDACMWEFTPGQALFAHSQWEAFRAPGASNAPSMAPTTNKSGKMGKAGKKMGKKMGKVGKTMNMKMKSR